MTVTRRRPPLRPAVSHAAGGEDGISLVEMLVAMFILAVVLAAFASTTMTSVASIADNERRSWGNQVANEVIEDFQARSWRRVGFYEDDAVPNTEGDPVVIGNARPAAEDGVSGPCTHPVAASPAAAPLHQESFERENTCFDVTRWIVWDQDHVDPATGVGEDYKRLVVEVRWTLRGRNHELVTSASRAPDPGNNVRFFSATLTASTDTVTYTDSDGDGDPDSASPSTLTFTAKFSHPAKTAPTLHYRYTDDTGTVHEALVPATATSSDSGATWTFTHSSLLPTPPQGEVIFIARGEAIDAPLTTEAQDTITFDYSSTAAVDVRSLTLNQGTKTPICVVSSSNKPSPNLTVDVNIRGLSEADDGRVGVTWNDGPADPLTAAHQGTNPEGDGAIFRLTVNNVYTFPTSPVTFQVYLRASASDPTWTLEWTDPNSYTTRSGSAC